MAEKKKCAPSLSKFYLHFDNLYFRVVDSRLSAIAAVQGSLQERRLYVGKRSQVWGTFIFYLRFTLG